MDKVLLHGEEESLSPRLSANTDTDSFVKTIPFSSNTNALLQKLTCSARNQLAVEAKLSSDHLKLSN